MNKKTFALGGVMTAVLGSAACGGGSVAVAPVEFEGMDDPQTVVQLAAGVTAGNPDAPITIAEFGDYQCPGCAGFAGTVKPQLDIAYLQSGQVKFVFFDYPLISIHPHAFLAARASRCAQDQDRFWEYHAEIFNNQRAWAGSATAPLGLFEDYAAAVGLDEATFRGCLRSEQHAELVTANMQLGNLLGVTGTPSVMVSDGGGVTRRLPDTSFETIRMIVDEMLGNLAGGAAETGEGNGS